ncbi:MAG: class B sortase [Eubacteriales bacterium]|nr:class B sortase [Eubacteriales bacterium]
MAAENLNAVWEEENGSYNANTVSDLKQNTGHMQTEAVHDESAETDTVKTLLPEASFEETVEEFDLSEIQSTYTGKKTSIINGMFVIRMFLLIACASMFMYCVYSIADRIIKDIEDKNLMENLIETTQQSSVVPRVAKTNSTPSTLSLYDALGVTEDENNYIEIDSTGKYDQILYTLMELKAKNNDIYGWIRCKGGMPNINYPIVKATDNSYYLDRNIYKSSSPAGSIFADFRNSFNHSDNYNTIFYGHCMTNGTMFRDIKDWYDSSTRNATAGQITIEIITPEAVYVYEIFAAYRSTGADFITVSFTNNAGYLSFLQSLLNKSVLKRNMSYDINTRIITLSTCTNVLSSPDERYVVHGILTKIIKYS